MVERKLFDKNALYSYTTKLQEAMKLKTSTYLRIVDSPKISCTTTNSDYYILFYSIFSSASLWCTSLISPNIKITT